MRARLACLAASLLASGGPSPEPDAPAWLVELRDASTPEARDAALAALAAVPPAELREGLEVVAERGDEPERDAALLAAGVVGDGEHLTLIVQLATPAHGARSHALEARLEAAVGALLERRPAAARRVGDAFGAAGAYLRPALLRALGRLPAELELETLVELLADPDGDEVAVLLALARCAPRAPPADERLRAHVRASLRGGDPRVLQAAARAVAALEDDGALADLVALLSAEAPVPAAARDALRRLAGVDLGERRGVWEGWLRAERAWWREHGARAGELLAGPDPAAAARVVRELAHRRVDRAGAAAALAVGLRRDEPELVRLACAALGQLGERRALPELRSLLDHEDPTVREAAARAARRLETPDPGPETARRFP